MAVSYNALNVSRLIILPKHYDDKHIKRQFYSDASYTCFLLSLAFSGDDDTLYFCWLMDTFSALAEEAR